MLQRILKEGQQDLSIYESEDIDRDVQDWIDKSFLQNFHENYNFETKAIFQFTDAYIKYHLKFDGVKERLHEFLYGKNFEVIPNLKKQSEEFEEVYEFGGFDSYTDMKKAYTGKKVISRINNPKKDFIEKVIAFTSVMIPYLAHISMHTNNTAQIEAMYKTMRKRDDKPLYQNYNNVRTLFFYKKDSMYYDPDYNHDIFVDKHDLMLNSYWVKMMRYLSDRIYNITGKSIKITKKVLCACMFFLEEMGLGKIKVGKRDLIEGLEKNTGFCKLEDLEINEISKFIPHATSHWFDKEGELDKIEKSLNVDMKEVLLEIYTIERKEDKPYSDSYKEKKRELALKGGYIKNKNKLDNGGVPTLNREQTDYKKNQRFELLELSEKIYEEMKFLAVAIENLNIDKKLKKLITMSRIFTNSENEFGRFYSRFNSMGKIQRNFLIKKLGYVEIDFNASVSNILIKFIQKHGGFYSKYPDENKNHDFYMDLAITIMKYFNININKKTKAYFRKLVKEITLIFTGNSSNRDIIRSLNNLKHKKHEEYPILNKLDAHKIIELFYETYPNLSAIHGISLYDMAILVESKVAYLMMVEMLKNGVIPFSIHDAFCVPIKDKNYYDNLKNEILNQVIGDLKEYFTKKYFPVKSAYIRTNEFKKTFLPQLVKVKNAYDIFEKTGSSEELDILSENSNTIFKDSSNLLIKISDETFTIHKDYYRLISYCILESLSKKDYEKVGFYLGRINQFWEDKKHLDNRKLCYYINNTDYLINEIFTNKFDISIFEELEPIKKGEGYINALKRMDKFINDYININNINNKSTYHKLTIIQYIGNLYLLRDTG